MTMYIKCFAGCGRIHVLDGNHKLQFQNCIFRVNLTYVHHSRSKRGEFVVTTGLARPEKSSGPGLKSFGSGPLSSGPKKILAKCIFPNFLPKISLVG